MPRRGFADVSLCAPNPPWFISALPSTMSDSSGSPLLVSNSFALARGVGGPGDGGTALDKHSKRS
eukprot:1693121-Pyramimonas_sp.AAC.2